MKRVLKYLQDTAAHPSATTAYLSPPGPEPQQRAHHRDHRRRTKEVEHHRDFHNDNHYPSAAAHTTPSHVSGSGTQSGISFETERHQYAQDNLLQSYELYIPEHGSDEEGEHSSERYWVVYIHGGFYRDPKITASSFHHTLSTLLTSPLYAHTASQIAGFASLNYRLSPHPDYPQDSHKTSNYEFRNARHPEHVNDVLTALGVLQHKHNFGSKYLLVGHSVGATMAFQVALSQRVPWDPSANIPAISSENVAPPIAILGVEGIYDFPALIKSIKNDKDKEKWYHEPMKGAFSDNEEVWLDVSPAQYSKEAYDREWTLTSASTPRLAIVAHSPHDELVPWSQVEAVQNVFAQGEDGVGSKIDSEVADTEIDFRVIELKGKHDAVWEKGQEMAKAIAEVLRALKEIGEAEGMREKLKGMAV